MFEPLEKDSGDLIVEFLVSGPFDLKFGKINTLDLIFNNLPMFFQIKLIQVCAAFQQLII